MPVGRPSKYKSEYCQELISHMSQGYSFESFAAVIDVNVDSIYEWLKVHKEFSEAKSIAYNKCLLFWEREGVKGLYSTTRRKTERDGSSTSMTQSMNARIFEINVKYRFKKWRDTDKNSDEETSNETPQLIINVTNN